MASVDAIDEHIRWEIGEILAEAGNEESATESAVALAQQLGYKDGSSISHALGSRRPGEELARRLDTAGYVPKLRGAKGKAVSFLTLINARRDVERRARQRGRRPRKAETYDAFLATPMASVPKDKSYEEERAGAERVTAALRTFCEFDVYCAAVGIESRKKFDVSWMAAEVNYRALVNSRFFVLYVPTQPAEPSGIWAEAGYALGIKKPSLYLTAGDVKLPYPMQGLPSHKAHEVMPPVLRLRVDNSDQAMDIIESQGTKLFNDLKERADKLQRAR